MTPEPTPDEAAALEAERTKLGGAAKANARIAAVRQFLEGTSSIEHANAVMASLVIARQIEAMEATMAAYRVRPIPVDAPAGPDRTDPGGGRVSEAAYQAMSPAERLDYFQSFDQTKLPPWRDPRLPEPRG